MCADALALGAAFGLAFVARFNLGWFASTENPDLGRLPYVAAGLIWVVAIVRALAARSMYDEDTLVPGGSEFSRALRSLPEGVAVVAFVSFLIRGEELSRSWFLLGVVASVLLLPGERLAFRSVLSSLRVRGWLRRPVVRVWGPDGPEDVGVPFPHRLAEFDVVGEVAPEHLLAGDPGDGDGRPLLIDSSDWDRDRLWEMVLAAGQRGSRVYVLSGLRAVSTERVTTRDLGGHTVMRVSPPRLSGVRAAEKRALDLTVVLLLAIPALALGAVLIVIQLIFNGRPVLYGQARLGRNAEEFRMWKFRSMEVNAESDTGPVWAEPDDPRRTGFGRFLRRSSLDELPQLWNVLKGDMSMVGPRPERPEFVEQFTADLRWYRYRLRIRPGLTGRAQSLGLRGQTPLESRIEEDNWYIENWSLGLDLQILARTVASVVKGENAR